MNKFTKRLCIALMCALAPVLFACADADENGGTLGPADGGEPGAAEETPAGVTEENGEEPAFFADNVPNHDFRGASFVHASVDNPNFSNVYFTEELTGEILNDAIYARTEYIKDRFNVEVTELMVGDGDVPGRWNRDINAGDSSFHMFTMRVDHAFPFWLNGSLIPWNDIPYIELDRPWWDQSINEFLTINHHQPMAIGAFNIGTYDLAYALLFNQQIVADRGLDSPYRLVRDGTWTMDAMLGMMRAFTEDIDGDGRMTGADHFGYVAHAKMVVPNFTVAAGAFMIRKDPHDLPYFAVGEERFMRVWERVYEIMWDEGHWWSGAPRDGDVPTSSIVTFQEDRALFMDTSFFEIERLRAMETDFGILPYPKFDLYQDRFYGRISYYNPTIVPVTNHELEMTGAIFEALNAASYRPGGVLSTYLDTILTVRNIRDEDSAEMLEIIFANFVVDMGDTTLCAHIRDSFIYSMFAGNNRQFASALERNEIRVQRELDRMIEAALDR